MFERLPETKLFSAPEEKVVALKSLRWLIILRFVGTMERGPWTAGRVAGNYTFAVSNVKGGSLQFLPVGDGSRLR